MNQEMKPADLLRSAGRLVERALIQLDTEEIVCTCCGAKRPRNSVEHLAYRRFTDLQTRLEDAAQSLDVALVDDERQCVDCGKKYALTKDEMSWYKRHDLELPKTCADCRAKRRARRAGQRTEPVDGNK